MTAGLSAANMANKLLDAFRGGANGSNITAPSAIYAALHTADPGSAGTTATSTAITDRQEVQMGAGASGSASLSNSPSWSSTGSDTITHISVWDASTAGNFLYSAALSASKSVTNGDTFNLTSLTFAYTPIAA